jgi:hypothetical protein
MSTFMTRELELIQGGPLLSIPLVSPIRTIGDEHTYSFLCNFFDLLKKTYGPYISARTLNVEATTQIINVYYKHYLAYNTIGCLVIQKISNRFFLKFNLFLMNSNGQSLIFDTNRYGSIFSYSELVNDLKCYIKEACTNIVNMQNMLDTQHHLEDYPILTYNDLGITRSKEWI